MNSDESSCQNSHILGGCLMWIEKHLCLDSEEDICARSTIFNVQICSCSFETLANALVTFVLGSFSLHIFDPMFGQFSWGCLPGYVGWLLLMVKEGISLWNAVMQVTGECLRNSSYHSFRSLKRMGQ